MASTIKLMAITIMWFVICSTVITTNGYETYDETDQLAEESTDEYDSEDNETTTNPNENLTLETTTSSPKDKRLAKEYTDDEGEDKEEVEEAADDDESSDPLQKILPKVKFNCKGKTEGYYADNEFCEVFHYCKTNGFRFTFMCPHETYYNTKLMACEYNSSVSLCKHQINLKINDTFNKIVKSAHDTGVKPGAGQHMETYESNIRTKTEKFIPTTTTTTTTTSSITTTDGHVIADPYLIKRRSTHRPRFTTTSSTTTTTTTAKPIVLQKPSVVKSIPKNHISNTDETIVNNKSKPSEPLTIRPFKGFGRHNNKTKNRRINKNNFNPFLIKNNNTNTNLNDNSNEQNVSNNFDTNIETTTEIDISDKFPTNAYPVINSYRNKLLQNLSQRNRQKSTRRTTTTPPPVLMPTTRPPVTTTVSPYEFFIPFDSENRFQTTADLFPLSSQQNHDNKHQRKSPVLTQNYFNTIIHLPNNESMENDQQFEENPINDKTNKQNFQQFSDYPSFMSKEANNQEFRDFNPFQRAPVFDNVYENQPKKIKHRVPSVDGMNPSESQMMSMKEMIAKLRQLNNNNQEINSGHENSELAAAETDGQQSEHKEESDGNSDGNGDDDEQVLTVPVLVPTGMSKSFMKQQLGSTLLKPTMIPFSSNGQQIPAYILQFQNGNRFNKRKHNNNRSKRQVFGWTSPYYRNSFGSQSYLPMTSLSSHVYSNGYPANAYHNSPHIQIGEKPGFLQSAQQQMPYYIPPRQMFGQSIPNTFMSNSFDNNNNIYDLSEFSDFYPNSRPNHIMAEDVVPPYRSVSLKRPTFKRPPQRQKIPQTKRDSNDTQTTPTPVTAIPVSPRPHSSSPPKQQFHAKNTNPFTDFSDSGISEAIKLFDNNDDPYQELRSQDFDSRALFGFDSPRSSYPSNFIPMPPKSRASIGSLNSRASRVNTYSQSPVNSIDPTFETNFYSDNFPPFPQFGVPDYRLPFVDIPDPTRNRNQGFRPKPNQIDSNKLTEKQEVINSNTNTTSSVRYSTPYLPEVLYTPEADTQKSNESERNPNHNYDTMDREELQTARTDDFKQSFGPSAARLEWHSLVGRYNTPLNASLNQIKAIDNKTSDQKVQNESQINLNTNKYISYGTRLTAGDNNRNNNNNNQNSTVSVKSSVRVVSSLEPQASNQVMISKKLGSSLPSSQQISETNESSDMNELYKRRATDQLMLFNYYNNLNLYNTKPKLRYIPSAPATTTSTVAPTTISTTTISSSITTTTPSPNTAKYPSTSHWSIRGWSNPYSTNLQTTTPLSTTPTAGKEYYNFEIIDLHNDSEGTTTQSIPETTLPTVNTRDPELPEPPPYEKAFQFSMHPNARAYSYSPKAIQTDISQYLNSLNSS